MRQSACLVLNPIMVYSYGFLFNCRTLLYLYSSFAITLIGKKELVALLSLSSWCLGIVVWLFLAVPWVCLQFVIVVFPDHTHLLFFSHCHIKTHSTIDLRDIQQVRLFLVNNLDKQVLGK